MERILRSRDVGRTCTLTHVRAKRVRDGDFVNADCVLYGKIGPERAQKYLRSHYHDDTIIVASVEHDTDYYAIPFEQFFELALKNKEKEKNHD